MTEPLRVGPAVTPADITPTTGSSPAAAGQAEASPPADSLRDKGPRKGVIPAVALETSLKTDRELGEHPWRVRSVNVDYGLMFDVRYSKSDLRLQRPGDGTDVMLHDVGGRDRTSAHYLYSMPKGQIRPDEPQSDVGVAVQFANNWGLEANLKHNKYVVMTTNEDPDQMVQMTGTLHGQGVDEVRSLKSVMPEYQITNGLNQISIMATRAVDLPAPWNHRFTYNLKAGPSVYLPYTKGSVVNADGTSSYRSGPYHLSGWGAIAEHSLRYEVPITEHVAASSELLHGVTYANLPNSTVAGGRVSQSLWANQLGVTVGVTYRLGE